MQDECEVDNDADYVIEEFDVLLSTNSNPDNVILPQFYILQHSLRARDNPYFKYDTDDPGDALPTEIRVKPLQRKIEIDLPGIDTVDEEMDTGSEEEEEEEQKLKPSGDLKVQKMKNYTLRSELMPMRKNYCLAIREEGKMYLTPLQAFCQLKPSFDSIPHSNANEIVQVRNQVVVGPGGKLAVPESGFDDEPEEETVVAKIEPRETRRGANIRIQNSKFWKQVEDQEVWEPLPFELAGSRASKECIAQVKAIADRVGKVDRGRKLTTEEYFDRIKPYPVKQEFHQPSQGNILADRIRGLTVRDQAKELLKHCQIQNFKWFCSHSHGDRGVLLEGLSEFGHLIKGRWIIKSNIAGYKGQNVAVRDQLLWRFSQHDSVTTKDFMKDTKIGVALAEKMLYEIADLHNVWKLKYEQDLEFSEQYPRIVSQHEEFWKRFVSQFGQGTSSRSFANRPLASTSGVPMEQLL